MQPRLPIEIILLIPSFLSGDKDKQALRKLCLTSSLFLHPSRTLLYNHLVLSFGPRYTESPLPGTRLLQLLQLSPGLSKYVKKLTISTIPGGQRWLGVDVTLPDALTRIGPNQITSFSLERISLDEWSSLRGATKSSIIDTCFSASLVDLTLCRAPFDLLKHCGPQLKRFEARGVELARNNNIEPPNSPPITLDSLCLNGYPFHKYIAHLLDPSSKIQLHALTKLEITSTSPADNTAASRILSHCRNTLETFIVQPYAIY
ncbi:hypothetical protein DFP72DRAFT_62572 [Ephemerocybe angulata]|uniref:Uncharacterized protein n=1 Tax=Ephemerocybe angulata TaxID=980116 RepID=A0A8H6LW35_9AGAR|nr:hypothetical protein DFP72DRAFT_62572 [Tulosesus angulatus]